MSEPLKHVIRPSLPWRDEADAMTECGLRADSYPSLSGDEASAEWKKLGAQRASLWFCMTCVHTTNRWPTWDEDPVGCLGREVERARHRQWSSASATPESDAFRTELLAIAQLIELHRDDFDSIIADLGDTVSLRERRAKRLQRRARR